MAMQQFRPASKNAKSSGLQGAKVSSAVLTLLLSLCLTPALSQAEEPGVTDKIIRIGASTQLEGDLKMFGQNTKLGMEAALAGQTVQKLSLIHI